MWEVRVREEFKLTPRFTMLLTDKEACGFTNDSVTTGRGAGLGDKTVSAGMDMLS